MAKIQKDTDKNILHVLETVMEGVGRAFGPNCEIVLHSLEDFSKSVVKIVNGHVTGRKVGSPLTDLGIEMLEKAEVLDRHVIGPYFNTLDDGRMLKCVTILICNAKGEPTGMLCINIDISIPFVKFAEVFSPNINENGSYPIEHFPLTPQELINKTLAVVRTEVSKVSKLSPAESTRLIVAELLKRGIFNVKGAIDFVAREFGVSRNTIYNYIRDVKLMDS